MNQAEYTEAAAEQALKTLLWSETIDLPCDEHEVPLPSVPGRMLCQQGKPFDQFYSPEDLDAGTHLKIRLDLGQFVEANWEDLQTIKADPETAGHDFILSRNETGAGFGSHRTRDEETRAAGERLRHEAQKFNPISLYLGDDLKIYYWSES